MKHHRDPLRLCGLAAACVLQATSLLIVARVHAETCEPPAATVVSVQGAVEAKRVGAAAWQPVVLEDRLCAGDSVRTGASSRADILLGDQSVLRVREQTVLVVQGPKDESSYLLDLLQGAAHFFSRQGARNLQVQTPYTVAGVRGTEFGVEVGAGSTTVRVFEGSVLASNSAGSLALADGQTAIAAEGQAPVLRLEARPRDAVRWTLYYPPVVYEARGTAPRADDPQFLTRRASERLAVGSVDAAIADIDAALAASPRDPDALALRSMVALVQNDKEEALRIADGAVAENPTSATALVAQSYARQAHFDLEGARASLEMAVEIAPENALAWARLAEIRSSLGDSKGALVAANRAAALDPGLGRTQTVLGFAYLGRVDVEEASTAFETAIALDSADPLPRLGLGLAKIRRGHLAEGRREIEIAASLDPSNALVRSYLGKAYFEEKRTHLDEREYDVAKELDPNDPTPWFYDAITKQTTNRPVEALQSYQKAIELNDNRAVYRSRLLLDSDLAARSAALGRVYGDLDFQNLALVEGWKSLDTDPSNYSAHRLLADSYAALPRHEIARVSELLQSQLLQPLNMTPIQPRLAESNLALISSGGPTAPGVNEFNPLFNRNGITVQTSGLAGENDTYAGEGVVAGIANNTSFSMGGLHFKTDGFRDNADQKDDIANAFVQQAFSPQTSLQAEYRYRNTDSGDLLLRFFPDNFFPGERDSEETNTYRLGGRHAFSPGSILLGSFIYQDADGRFKDDEVPDPVITLIDQSSSQHAYSGELQHILRWRYINVTTGAGTFNVDGNLDTIVRFSPDSGIPDFSDTTPTDVKHTNVYSYAYLNLLHNVTYTQGFSADYVDSDSPDVDEKDQFNPKVGITWEPIPDTTLRAAAFRVLKRTLVTDQTLEPTQVAGFNQFFDDFNGTDAWRYGGAVDQKFSRSIFGGLEFSKRDVKVPYLTFSDTGPPTASHVDWDEYLGRAYLFWTPHPWVSLRAEYGYERVKRDEQLTNGVKEMDSHRVPLGISFFHPCGLSASTTATYFHQDGQFLRFLDTGFVELDDATDDFWTIDAAATYRLPKRYGFVTFGATNLFDEEFSYFDTDLRNPSIQPDRMLFGRVTLVLP